MGGRDNKISRHYTQDRVWKVCAKEKDKWRGNRSYYCKRKRYKGNNRILAIK